MERNDRLLRMKGRFSGWLQEPRFLRASFGRAKFAFLMVCADTFLAASLRPKIWLLAVFFWMSFIIFSTYRRIADIGVTEWVAIPCSILFLSPYLILHFRYTPQMSRIVVLSVIALQIPLMLRKSKRRAQSL